MYHVKDMDRVGIDSEFEETITEEIYKFKDSRCVTNNSKTLTIGNINIASFFIFL